jgi:hypothetical protein
MRATANRRQGMRQQLTLRLIGITAMSELRACGRFPISTVSMNPGLSILALAGGPH